MASISKKGGKFEKEFCKELSLWWTDGKRDDIFYSTSGSGGRATMRLKRGLCTENASGDVCSLSEIGFPYIHYFLTEIKRGYDLKRKSSIDFIEFVDSPNKKTNKLKEWIVKAEKEKSANFRKGILIVIKRDFKIPWVIIDSITLHRFAISFSRLKNEFIMFSVNDLTYYAFPLIRFYEIFTPKTFIDTAEETKIKRRTRNAHQKACH